VVRPRLLWELTAATPTTRDDVLHAAEHPSYHRERNHEPPVRIQPPKHIPQQSSGDSKERCLDDVVCNPSTGDEYVVEPKKVVEKGLHFRPRVQHNIARVPEDVLCHVHYGKGMVKQPCLNSKGECGQDNKVVVDL
jgi:hypothetical protein